MEEDVLKKMTKHYKTGNTMPSEMIKQIISTNNLFQSIFYTRQSVQGLLDMDIYTGKAADPVKHFHKLMSEYLIPESKGVLFVSRFSHIIMVMMLDIILTCGQKDCHMMHSAFSKRDGLNNKKLGPNIEKEILQRVVVVTRRKASKPFLAVKFRTKHS